MADMTEDVFAAYPFGKAALKKFASDDPNFRLYCAGYVDDKSGIMRVDGAVFREAKRGPNKGKLSIMVEGTKQTVHVTREDMEQYKEDE